MFGYEKSTKVTSIEQAEQRSKPNNGASRTTEQAKQQRKSNNKATRTKKQAEQSKPKRANRREQAD